jgi:uncharacterized protein (TIGR02271 family)
VTRSEEELRVDTSATEAGRVRARKVNDTYHVDQVVPREVEHAQMERVEVEAGDSGQVETLPDGSISIPVFEEQIVIEKRLVVRERVILRKYRTTEEHRVEADLRRERLEIDASPDIADRVSGQLDDEPL